jgi:hypothetical protein
MKVFCSVIFGWAMIFGLCVAGAGRAGEVPNIAAAKVAEEVAPLCEPGKLYAGDKTWQSVMSTELPDGTSLSVGSAYLVVKVAEVVGSTGDLRGRIIDHFKAKYWRPKEGDSEGMGGYGAGGSPSVVEHYGTGYSVLSGKNSLGLQVRTISLQPGFVGIVLIFSRTAPADAAR